MAVRSSVPTVKDALYDRLAARAGLISPGLLVSDGRPTKPPLEYVSVEDVPTTDYTQQQLGGGAPPHARSEDYIIEVYCSVTRQGGQQRECRQRAYDLAAEVEDELADDPTINGTMREGHLADVVGGGLAETADDMKHGAVVLLRIHCRTLIGP